MCLALIGSGRSRSDVSVFGGIGCPDQALAPLLAGRSDPHLLATAAVDRYALLTENVSDFARIADERLTAGGYYPGALIALSSRFPRRPNPIPKIAAAIRAIAGEALDDRLVYLGQQSD